MAKYRTLITFVFFVYIDVAKIVSYSPPEVSGEVLLSSTGVDPWGTPLAGETADLLIKTKKELIPISVEGINISSSSHPCDGIYGTADFVSKLQDLMLSYGVLSVFSGFGAPPQIISKSGSLRYGGLFDIAWEGAVINGKSVPPSPWLTPHCGHRDGNTMDVSYSSFAGPSDKVLRKLFESIAGDTEVSISAETDHWHLHTN